MSEAGQKPQARPHVLWLVSEDNSPEFVEPYGDLACTPTLRALARTGVTYDNAFATAPVCAPSRFSIITGFYASSYTPACHMRAGDMGQLPGWMRGFPAYLREAGYYCTNNAKQDYNAPVDATDAWDESSTSAHWRNRPADKPFFAVFNYGTTHESKAHPGNAEPLLDGVRPEDVSLPAYHPDLPELRADRARYYDQNTRLDAELAARLAEIEADGLAEDTIVFYYADHGGVLPRSKRFCYDSGLRVPLIVHVPEKWQHLWPHPPGSRADDLVTLMDLGPTVLSLAGLRIPEKMNERTIAEPMHGQAIAGPHRALPARHVFGLRNRTGERYDLVRTVRNARYRYIRNYMPHLPGGQHIEYLFRQSGVRRWQEAYQAGGLDAVRSAFWEPKPFEELYDLVDDPDEVRNLAASHDHQPMLAWLRQVLDRHLIATRDTGFIPEGSPLEHPDQAADDDAYPLGRVMEIAAIAARCDTRQLPQLSDALTDDTEPVRYWAALGCLMLGDQVAPAHTALKTCLTDSSPSVQVVAAEALGRADVLTSLALEHHQPRIRLQAINALDRLSETLRTVPPDTFSDAAQDPDNDVRKVAEHVLKRTSQPLEHA